MKKIIGKFIKTDGVVMKLYSSCIFIIRSMIYKKYRKKYEIDEKMIIFESFFGRSYSDSPKELYENMLEDKRFIDYKFVWCFRNPDKKSNISKLENAVLVKFKSKDYYKYYCQAKYIISNSRIDTFIQKKMVRFIFRLGTGLL